MQAMDETADTEHLKEIRELLRTLLAPKALVEELGGTQDRGLGSRRKPFHRRSMSAATMSAAQ